MKEKKRFEMVYRQGTMNVTEIWVDTETGVTVTQAGRPKVVDIELNVYAAFHKEDVEIDLYGE